MSKSEAPDPWNSITEITGTYEWYDFLINDAIKQLQNGNTFKIKMGIITIHPNAKILTFRLQAKSRSDLINMTKEYWLTNDSRRRFICEYSSYRGISGEPRV